MISLIILLAGIANLIMGTIVLLGGKGKKGLKSFVTMSYMTFIWALCNFFIYRADYPIFVKFSYAMGVVVMTFILVWVYSLGDSSKRSRMLTLLPIYITGALLALLPILSDLVVYDIQKSAAGGFDEKEGALFFLYVLYFLVTYFVVLVRLVKLFRQSKGIEKKQNQLLLVGFSIFAGLSITFSFILPLFDYKGLIDLDVPITMVFVFFVSYAIIGYKWMNIKLIATELLSILIVAISLMDIFLASTVEQQFYKIVVFVILLTLAIFLIKSVLNEIKRKEELKKANDKLRANEIILAKANKELSNLDKAKNEFLNIASHQLRTPVSVIRGIVSLLREGDMDKMPPETKKHFYDGAWAKCQKLETIINDILNATSFSNRKFSLKGETVAPLDLVDLVKKVADGFTLEVKERELDLKVLPPAKPLPKVMGQAEFLEEVFVNLINNAIKYTPSGKMTNDVRSVRKEGRGKITVSFSDDKKDGGAVTVKVADNGIGIPAEALPRLFHKFERAQNARNMCLDY